MNTISYVKTPYTTEDETIWHNLRVSDEMLNLELFLISATTWFEHNPTKNYQDFETELRTRKYKRNAELTEREFNTHLYAKTPCLRDGFKLVSPNNKYEPEYECVYSCRPKQYALMEIKKYWSSYEKNFEGLGKAGMLVVEDSKEKITNDEYFKLFNEEQMREYEDIKKCKKIIEFKQLSIDEYFKVIETELKNKYQCEPTLSVIAMAYDGYPIMGFVNDGKLIHDMGIKFGYDRNNNQTYELVRLTQ